MNIEYLENWQSNNYEKLKSKKISDIILPGSHDSGAYIFNLDIPIYDGNPAVFKLLAQIPLRWLGGKYIIERWGITQDKNIQEQLLNGIRFFDFRVFYDKLNDKFRLGHRFPAETFDEIIDQILNFLKDNPKEFIIIKMGLDWDNRRLIIDNNLRPEFWNRFYKKIGSKIYDNHSNDITYQGLMDEGKNIIIIDFHMLFPHNQFMELNKSYKYSEYQDINRAVKYSKGWLKSINRGQYSILYTNITGSATTIVYDVVCNLSNIIMIFLLIYIINQLYNKRFNILNISIIIIYIILSDLICYFRMKGLKYKEPEYQKRMIDILKDEDDIKISTIVMDYPTQENIKYIISLNK